MPDVSVVPDTRISAEMRAAIGLEMGRQVSFPVTASDIRRWALAVYYPQRPPAEFIAEDVAATGQYGGIVAPQEFNPFAWLADQSESRGGDLDQNDPDRPERILGITGPGLKFMLNGGMQVEYGAPMRPGDVITSVSRLGDYAERSGRLGLMLFTVFEDTWTNQRGELVKRTQNTLIRY
jgi:hypothetical protein